MARTTVDEVSKILDNTGLDNSQISGYIDSANRGEIEKWWAAHLIASTVERTTDQEKVGDVSAKYTGKWGEGLKSTPYGQTVLQLDTTGTLQKSGKQAVYFKAIKSFDE